MTKPPQFALAPDGTRIAFDVSGSGFPLMLIHGAGQTRQNWHAGGYVDRFKETFTVIAIDLPGIGNSDQPVDSDGLLIDTISSHLLAVIDSCGADKFSILGYSLGGYIARFMASRIDRVESIVLFGAPFGPAVTEEFDRYIDTFIAKYEPLAEKIQRNKKPSTVKGQIPSLIAYFKAMRKWPSVEPEAIKCPALLACGDRNKPVYKWLKDNRDKLDANIQTVTFKGLNHPQEFDRIDLVFPSIDKFFKQQIIPQESSNVA
ncbi:MAG: alpha/beta hydrolase [Anaerolineales bacterium]|nr:alpha/beta hydrolase [Anaerolineales bacterium]